MQGQQNIPLSEWTWVALVNCAAWVQPLQTSFKQDPARCHVSKVCILTLQSKHWVPTPLSFLKPTSCPPESASKNHAQTTSCALISQPFWDQWNSIDRTKSTKTIQVKTLFGGVTPTFFPSQHALVMLSFVIYNSYRLIILCFSLSDGSLNKC